jgi:RimJ/RimL family protein N-acetyltransferase
MKFKGVYRNEGSSLSLGPFFMSDVRKIANLMRDERHVYARDDTLTDPRRFFTQRVRAPDSLYFAIRREKKVVAYGAFDPIADGVTIIQLWNKAIAGGVETRRIIRLMLSYAFGELGLRKTCATTVKSNEKLLGIYKSMGVPVEGCLRKQRSIDGSLHDLVMVGLLREEFEKWQYH